MISFKNKKNWFKAILFILIVVSFFTVNQLQAQAWERQQDRVVAGGAEYGKGLSKYNPLNMGTNLIEGVLHLFQAFGGLVLSIGMSVVDLVMSDELYDEIFFQGTALTAINTGWGLVRDFVNMFFILILIFVAIATILKINKYSDKKFVVYVISAALFVNFSKPITLFIIDISNLAMSFFMSNIREGNTSYSSALMSATGMGQAFKSETASNEARYMSWIVEAIFKFIMGIMLLALGLSLVIRLVALWVLIILSPLAFFALALPGTAIGNIKTTWFNKLTYWCAFGPVMLFFLWLAIVLVSAVSLNVGLSSAEMEIAGNNKTGFVIGALKIFIPYFSCIYMLFYGFDLSKKIANQAGDGAAWGLGKAGKLAKGAAFIGTAGYGLGYGKAYVQNKKADFKENKEARMLSKRAQLGSKSAKTAHEQNLQREQMKDWDENGVPSEDELKKILVEQPSSKNTVANYFGGKGADTTAQLNAKKKAAAMKLAENGKLNMTRNPDGSLGDDSYARARELFKDSPETLNKFETLARKKNRGAMIEHKIESEMSAEINKKIVNENTRRGSLMTSDEEDIFRRTEEGRYRESVYEEQLGKMKLSEITDQSVGFLKDKNVAEYIKRKQAAGDSRFTREQLMEHLAKNTDAEKQGALKKFISTATGEKLSGRDEKDAMRDMNE